MGKAAMCIKMLEILNTGRVYKVSELADFLETNPRNIVEYKKELEECGYYIDSIPGRYGGYQLNQVNLLPELRFSKLEKEALSNSMNCLLSKKDFLDKEKYLGCISKAYSSIKQQEAENDVMVINRFPLAMSQDELSKRYSFINGAIKSKKIDKIQLCFTGKH